MKKQLILGVLLLGTMWGTAQEYKERNRFIDKIVFSVQVGHDLFKSGMLESTLPADAYTFSSDQGWLDPTPTNVNLPLFSVLSGYRQTHGINARYNVYELNDETSFSIETGAQLGFNYVRYNEYVDPTPLNAQMSNGTVYNVTTQRELNGLHGLFSISVPLYLSFNTGNGSTFFSVVDKGWTLGWGYEMVYSSFPNFNGYGGNRISLTPAFKIGRRSWGGWLNNYLREYYFKFSWSGERENSLIPLVGSGGSSDLDISRRYFLSAGMKYYINY